MPWACGVASCIVVGPGGDFRMLASGYHARTVLLELFELPRPSTGATHYRTGPLPMFTLVNGAIVLACVSVIGILLVLNNILGGIRDLLAEARTTNAYLQGFVDTYNEFADEHNVLQAQAQADAKAAQSEEGDK